MHASQQHSDQLQWTIKRSSCSCRCIAQTPAQLVYTYTARVQVLSIESNLLFDNPAMLDYVLFAHDVSRYGPSTGKKMATFLSTGNVVSSTGLDLMQVCTCTYTLEYH
jgi:hypothetical protein